MSKKPILKSFALLFLAGLFSITSFAQIKNGKVTFDLSKPGQEAGLKSADATIKRSLADAITLSTRSRSATIQSETIEVPVKEATPYLAAGFIMKYENYEGYITYYLRHSKDNKTWSEWTMVQQEDDEENVFSTTLAFLDKDVKYVQFMLSMRKKSKNFPEIKDITLFFTSPGSTNDGAIEKSMMETKKAVENTDPTTKAYPRPSYVNRKGWGCPQAENSSARTLTNVTHLVVHHSAGNTYSNDFPSVVRSYWDYHVNGRGWADIGYNWLIDRNGVVYKGRAWKSSTQENVQGAHNSINGNTSGICFIGDFQNGRLPSTAQWNSGFKIMAFLCDKYGLNPTAKTYHSALGKTNDVIDGHKDSGGYITGTSCPGDIAKYYSKIRNGVKDLLGGTTGPSSLSASIASCPSNNVTFKWANKGTGWQIHVSTSSTFSSYYLKWVSGLTSYTGPTGFVKKADNSAFAGFTPGTKYYWRIYYDGKYSSTLSFTMHTCPPSGLTATQSSCPNNNVTFKWSSSGTGWQIHVSTSSSFSTYYLKWVSGKTSYTGPAGFVHNSTNAAMPALKEGTKYYWRMYYSGKYTSTYSFTMHTCAQSITENIDEQENYSSQSSENVTDIDVIEENSEFMVYPNPNRGLLTIELNNSENQEFANMGGLLDARP